MASFDDDEQGGATDSVGGTIASLTALESAIDFMMPSSEDEEASPSSAATNGRGGGGYCFDLTHYHSFQSVSYLIPTRICAGCGERIQLSTSSLLMISSRQKPNQVVQCVACGVFAHRSCGFSKSHVQWKEDQFCPINYPFIQKKRKEEMMSSSNVVKIIEQNDNTTPTTEEGIISDQTVGGNEEVEGGEEEAAIDLNGVKETSSDVVQRSMIPSHVRSIDKLGSWFHNNNNKNNSGSSSQQKIHRRMTEDEHISSKSVVDPSIVPPSDDCGHDDDPDTFPTTSVQQSSGLPEIFRKICLDPSPNSYVKNHFASGGDDNDDGDQKTTAKSNQHDIPSICTIVSEDGVLDGSKIRRKISKANFPFLSASSLFEASSSLSKKEGYETNSNNMNNSTLKQSKTWGIPTSTHISSLQKGQDVLSFDRTNEAADNVDHRAPNFVTNDSSCVTNINKEYVLTNLQRCGGKTINHPPPRTMFSSNKEIPRSQFDEIGDTAGKKISFQWTESGPPTHWATKQTVFDEISANSSKRKKEIELNDDDDDGSLHFTSHPFASVSRALHENIIEQFRPMVSLILQKDGETGFPAEKNENDVDNRNNKVDTPPLASDQPTARVEGILEIASPKDDPTKQTQRLRLATVAGGIAGGVVGLAVAGPFGGAIGAKAGQTAGILGVLWEGSVTVGVVASGFAVGRYTGQQLEDKIEAKRVLALGEDGKKRVLLIRPTVKTDPIWSEIYVKERQSFRSNNSGLPSFNLLPNEAAVAKRERYEREVDIVRTAEEEIPTEDKVFLLVSRILNNKESLPGHIYRCLLQRLIERSEERGPVQDIFERLRKITEIKSRDVNIDDDDEEEEEDGDDCDYETEEMLVDLSRARRQDSHAVIKYVTATLLEVRPGFGVSPSITELTASAVEALVFGELYGLIIEEIEADHDEQDNALLGKIANFERLQQAKSADRGGYNDYKTCVSEPALSSLHQLPHSHSAVDKLRYCVEFLERISFFFSSCSVDGKKRSAMGADSLLKMVCQHILVAKVFGINAQIGFVEEFARDEQLLRGKEGYALVTLQASLHFLNASNDFEKDIFGAD